MNEHSQEKESGLVKDVDSDMVNSKLSFVDFEMQLLEVFLKSILNEKENENK